MRATPQRVAAAFVLLAFAISIVSASRHIVPEHDFGIRYAGGVVARSGHNPYDTVQAGTAMRRAQAGSYRAGGGGREFDDPPPVALLFAGISLLPYRVAVALWFACSLAAAVTIMWATAWVFRYRPKSVAEALTLSALGLAFGPLRFGVAGMQLDPIFGAAALAAFALSVRRRRSGALIGALGLIGVFKPQLGLVPMLSTVGRSTRAVIGFVLTLAALAIASAVLVPSASWPRWVQGVENLPRYSFAQRVPLALLLMATVAVWVRARSLLSHEVIAFCAAATLGVNAFALVHLHPFSGTLLIIPFVVALRVGLLPDASGGRRICTAILVGVLAAGAVAPATVYGGSHAAFFPIATAAALAAAAWVYLPRERPLIALAFLVNVAAVASSLNTTTARLLIATASCGLAALVASADEALLTTER